MEFRQIYKDNRTLMYKINYKSNIRNINAKVDKQNEITVTAPTYIAIEAVDSFILDHFDRFYKFIENLKENSLIDINANIISLFTKKYHLKLQNVTGREKYEIIDNKIYLFLRNESNKKNMIMKIYHDQASEYLIKRGKDLAKKLNFQVTGGFQTKWYEAKWGQCNVVDKRITLADQLIMFNDEIIDYVIIHELCHLVHANHSPEFWALVENFYPKYKWAREKLKFQC